MASVQSVKSVKGDVKPASRVLETSRERIEIPLPDLGFEACPDGDDRLLGIARLRALNDGR
jgi:hypothetical protein